MIRIAKRLPGVVAVLALAACASAPLHYYTLVAPAGGSEVVSDQVAPALPFELLPVSIPAQVDQPQLVVREGGQGVAMLDGERWIAPLGDEVRAALSADLARALGSADVSALPGNGQSRLRIKVDVRRFDSQPGSYALVEASWSVRVVPDEKAVAQACSSRISEAVGPGYPALVQGHQRAIGQLAAQIGAVARALSAGQGAVCPAG